MSKKILFPLLMAVLAALAIGGVAYAASGDAPTVEQFDRPRLAGLGQVTAIGADQFTVQLKRGGEKTYTVDTQTKFFAAAGDVAQFSDLKTGGWVLTLERRAGQKQLVARRVVLLPPGFDPAQVTQRNVGEIASINEGFFILHTRKGDDLTIQFSVDTTFLGRAVRKPADLQVGMQAAVGSHTDNGTLTAIIVAAGEKLQRHIGQVTAVDVAAGTFTLHTRRGADLTITVNADTRFLSKNGDVKALDDLQVGKRVFVAAHPLDDGTLLAVRIATK